jgi:hypothetical protein
MRTFNITIGSNNATGKVEKHKAIAVVAYEFDGFTYTETSGYWRGKCEPSAVFTIATDKTEIVFEVAARLREVLDQESVMVTVIGESIFV